MARGQVRIIGGKWRGRKLTIPALAEVRPTPDRVRETLFNWLTSYIVDAVCLDLFAGSGALGFEALSRGAASVVFIDQASAATKMLADELTRFGATNAQVYQAKIPQQLPSFTQPFDLVFLDPPYQADLLYPICQLLEAKNLLSATALIYLESDKPLEANLLPPNWEILKDKKAGQVGYYLVKRKGASP
jgi:16S rRNA (guanine966-N2)-methyltransferase